MGTKEATVKKAFKYSEIKSQDFQQLIAKISRTPTQVHRANRIKQLLDVVDEIWNRTFEEFKTDLLQKHADKDDQGKVISEAGDFSDVVISDANMPAYQKDFAEFQNRTVEVECLPITTDTVSDMKISAREMQLLGALFVLESGPGVPNLGVAR